MRRMIDPSKDKFAYFKDNIQTAEDKEEFDASQYYYNRDDLSGKALGNGTPGLSLSDGNSGLGGNLNPYSMGGLGSGMMDGDMSGIGGMNPSGAVGNGLFSGFNTSTSGGLPGSFLGGRVGHDISRLSAAGGGPVGAMGAGVGGPPPDHLAAVIKSRGFQQEAKPPDMSEFPALGSRLGSMSLDGGSSGGDTTAADRLRQQQPNEFVIQKEDFPALSSYISSSSNDKSNTNSTNDQISPEGSSNKRTSSFTSSVHDNVPRTQQQGGSIGSRGAVTAVAAASMSMAGSSSSSNSSSPSNNNSVSLVGGSFGGGHLKGSSKTGGTALDANNLYGLLGMLHTIIRPGASSNEAGTGGEKKNLVAVGCDLTSLGLNLNSSEPLLPTFASPWAEGPATTEPQFTLPMCYYNQPPVLKTTHLTKFHLETLFYIFYMLPKDVLQAYAAQELYTREWRYHMEMKLWLKRATPSEITSLSSNSSTNSNNTTSSTNNSSTGGGNSGTTGAGGSASNSGQQFIYFDTNTWERRIFAGGNVSTSGLLSEEEVRVKFNNSPTP